MADPKIKAEMKEKLHSVINDIKPKEIKTINNVQLIDGKITADFNIEKRGGKEPMTYEPPTKRIFDGFDQFSEQAEQFLSKEE